MSKIITPKRKNFRHLPTKTGRFGLHMQLSNKAIMMVCIMGPTFKPVGLQGGQLITKSVALCHNCSTGLLSA